MSRKPEPFVLLSIRHHVATWECRECRNYQRLPIDDEPVAWRCEGSDTCTRMVCHQCLGAYAAEDEATCQNCGVHACREHMQMNVADSMIGAWKRICDICAKKLAEPEDESAEVAR